MNVSHYENRVEFSIRRKNRVIKFTAMPNRIKYYVKKSDWINGSSYDSEAFRFDRDNWHIAMPEQITDGPRVFNYGFKTIGEMYEYCKRFEDVVIEDKEMMVPLA
jgi:hypothetical protein